jgi:NADPH:quinone reductase-like Zn-dependent oxidoreductase
MRAVVLTKHGEPDVLQVQERPDPEPSPGEIAIDVGAAGVNFADVMARVGLYPDAPKPPCVVGYEVAGTVTAVGEGVDGLAAGDRVMAGTRFGGYASRVVVPAHDAIPLPDALSFEQGAALPVNASTAWAGLIEYGALKPGQRVLLHAAGGGVGSLATQIAKDVGAEVWGTASPGKHGAIRENGVDHALDYTESGWERGLPTFDVIMDALGGRSFRRSYKLLRPGGRLICFGASGVMSGDKRNLVAAVRTAASMPRFGLIGQMSASKSVIGLNMLTLWDEHGTLAPWIEPMIGMLERGALRPIVSEAVPFDRAGDAHRALSSRRNVGKVVLVP